ncbi:hypothetical protein ACFLUZ_00960 [Chloroflexota bacterium]
MGSVDSQYCFGSLPCFTASHNDGGLGRCTCSYRFAGNMVRDELDVRRLGEEPSRLKQAFYFNGEESYFKSG